MKNDTVKTVSTVHAREQFAELINRAIYGNSPTILARRGKKIAVIISYEEFIKIYDEELKKSILE